MNRKTNIFYNIEEDSRFLTFNNYSEALTGDILAIDYKLWPSRFICLYIDELDIKNLTLNGEEDNIENRQLKYNENKQLLISYLEKYYENKLAVLRDNIDNDKLIDLKPLNYLIDTLYYFIYNIKKSINPSEYQTINNCNDLQKEVALNNNIQDLIDFNYISEIVEQDYNGTYADIICTINPHEWKKPIISYDNPTNINLNVENYVSIVDDTECLYGWDDITDDNNENSNQHKIYNKVHVQPIIDDINNDDENNQSLYYAKSYINSIEYDIVDLNSSNKKLKFNILIPLFNCINTENEYDISNTEEDSNILELNNKVNIPLGIYFTGDTIELNKDNKYATNWSVLITTQFSAFPYSFNITKNFDSSESYKQAFMTYAEILANQSDTYSVFNKYDSIIKTLQNKIILLENKINNVSSVQNIDDLAKSIADLKSKQEQLSIELNNEINNIRNLIDEARIKWQVKSSRN